MSGYVVVVSLLACASGLAQPGDQGPHYPAGGPQYRSSSVCLACHPTQHEYWTTSMHAQAVTDPVFRMAYGRAMVKYGPEIREFCLGCHAPTTMVTNEYDLEHPLTREGVTCDFCHTVTDVVEARPKSSFVVQLGDTKFGPLRDVAPHEALTFQYSALHESSRLCSGCHELYTEGGVGIMGTYTEWRQSPYAAEGLQCQGCHMPELPGVPSVPPSIRETSNVAHAHEFLGGHSQARLQKAASLRVWARREGDKIFVEADVTNVGAGHKLPTGMPTRQVSLVVRLADGEGNVLASQRVIYQKVLAGEDGEPLLRAECVMVETATVLSDNRIAPKETRHEKFVFEGVPGDRSVNVRAELEYRFFDVAVMERSVLNVPMTAAEKIVSAKDAGGTRIAVVALAGVTLVVLVVLIVVAWAHGRSKRQQEVQP